jgi:hypothetical protein
MALGNSACLRLRQLSVVQQLVQDRASLVQPEALAGCGISNCVLAEYSSAGIALQDDPYTPSTHTSLESPRNGGIYGYFTFEHGLLQGEPFIITSKWGC